MLDRESRLETQITSSGVSLYGQDPALPGIRSSRIARATAPIVTQVSTCNLSSLFTFIYLMEPHGSY